MKKIAMHICCCICFVEPYKDLSDKYDIYGIYYNPNIQPFDEYLNRLNALKSIIKDYKLTSLISNDYNPNDYYEITKNEIESKKEICRKCYELRLLNTVNIAKSLNIEYFTTTLLGSPYQDYDLICETGNKIREINKIEFISSKNWAKNYYKSKEEGRKRNLYIQKYCGCIYSKMGRKFEKIHDFQRT